MIFGIDRKQWWAHNDAGGVVKLGAKEQGPAMISKRCDPRHH
jgi:hypothetical protein